MYIICQIRSSSPSKRFSRSDHYNQVDDVCEIFPVSLSADIYINNPSAMSSFDRPSTDLPQCCGVSLVHSPSVWPPPLVVPSSLPQRPPPPPPPPMQVLFSSAPPLSLPLACFQLAYLTTSTITQLRQRPSHNQSSLILSWYVLFSETTYIIC
jgi:hypothetical protein